MSDTAQPITPQLIEKASKADAIARANEQEKEALLKALEVEGPWSRHDATERIREDITQAAACFARICTRVAWGHAEMEQQEWIDWVEEDLGVARRTAFGWLSVARKVIAAGPSSSRLLALPATKLIDIATTLPEEEIQRLEAGGSVGEITVDRIAQMSTREVRKALRAEKKKREAEEQRSGELEARAERLTQQVGEMTYGQRDDQELRRQLSDIGGAFNLDFCRIEALISKIDWPSASPSLRSKLAAEVEQVRTRAAELQRVVDPLVGPGGRLDVLTQDAKVARLSSDADAVLNQLRMRKPVGMELANGEVFYANQLPFTWGHSRKIEALNELSDAGLIEWGSEADIVFKGAAPELEVPEWMSKRTGEPGESGGLGVNLRPVPEPED